MLRRRLELPRDIVPIDDWALAVVGYRREMFEQYIGQFRLTIRDSFIQVDIRPDQTTCTLRDGPGLRFAHEGEPVELRADAPAISRSTSTALPEEMASEVDVTT